MFERAFVCLSACLPPGKQTKLAGPRVPGGLHGELEPVPPDGRERSRGGVLGGGRQALLLQVRGPRGNLHTLLFDDCCRGNCGLPSTACYYL